LEGTRASSSGQSISVKKRKEKAKTTSSVHWHWHQHFFIQLFTLNLPSGAVDAIRTSQQPLFAGYRMEKGCMYLIWICIILRKNGFINTYDIPVWGTR
jgi:hypothetical protein